MLGYIARRLGQAVLVVFAAYVVSFVILYVLPGDPILAVYAGGDVGAIDDEKLAALRAEFGFDQPMWQQFLTRFGGALVGDFGVSIKNGQSVTSVVAAALPSTLALVAVSLVIAVVVGALLALIATGTRSNWLRQALLALPAFGVSAPTFWVGLMLLQLFAFQLRLLPAVGDGGFASIILPAVTLALPGAATVAQVLAKSLMTTHEEPYIATAVAMGLGPRTIHYRDAFRNAMIPALTVSGMLIANMIGGSVVVESVFSRQGIGQVTVHAVLAHDIPIVQAVVVLGAVIFVLVNLVVDLCYPLIDPRLRSALVKG